MKPKSYGQDYANAQLGSSRSFPRRFVRSFYLKDILKHVSGPTLDFGCGVGDMLAKLPPGSKGLDINPFAVQHCRSRGLDADLYDPQVDEYRLADFPTDVFKTLLLTHVMEHMENPDMVLKTLFNACKRLGIKRIVLTVPCIKGFHFDPTHRTFVDFDYLKQRGLMQTEHFKLSQLSYYPLNMKWIGRFYTFHELRAVFDERTELVSSQP